MTDLISRADAIEAVCKAVCEDDVSIFPECDQIKYCDEIQALLALPSAEADWIPCSERLPETPKHYYDRSLYLTCTKTGYITSIYWWDGWNCLMGEDGTIYREHEIKDIVAWMPLPEPYREDGEEE